MKREIQLNTLAEKRTQNSSHAVTSPGSKVQTKEEAQKTAEQLKKEEDENQKALESKKFPSMGYLRKMGVSNFKPSIHHKVQSGHKVFNILNNPMIALASPRIECQWANGMPPRPPKLNRKLQDDFDETCANSELALSIDEINQKAAKSPRKNSKKKAKKLAAAKARKVAR